MPEIDLIFYQDDDGSVLLVDWLDQLPPKAQLKCLARIERLAELGHELRRPEADYLRDDIYELRASLRGIHYRILYFFHGEAAVVLSHGSVKERIVPPKEINRAVRHKEKFQENCARYSFRPKREEGPP
jgi:hypothetical protein